MLMHYSAERMNLGDPGLTPAINSLSCSPLLLSRVASLHVAGGLLLLQVISKSQRSIHLGEMAVFGRWTLWH